MAAQQHIRVSVATMAVMSDGGSQGVVLNGTVGTANRTSVCSNLPA
jgi:hypothetical protein